MSHMHTPQIRGFIPGSGTTRCISPRKPNAVVGAPPAAYMPPQTVLSVRLNAPITDREANTIFVGVFYIQRC